MKILKTLILVGFAQLTFAQHGANQLYGNQSVSNSYMNQTQNSQNGGGYKTIIGKNSLSFEVNVLKHAPSTNYMITLGLNEEAENAKTCNQKINKRIEGFLHSIKKLGVGKEDVYIDFITQNKIYDYVKTNENEHNVNLNQVERGFEIKKNIVLSMSDISEFDKLVEIASLFDIHNIIDVNYQNDNRNKIYEELFEEASKIINQRKKLIPHNKHIFDTTPTYSIEFFSVQPGNSYKKFQAYESGEINTINNYYKSDVAIFKKEVRKRNSYYFDRIANQQFDKILNSKSPKVGLQYVMKVNVVYNRKN
jgi:predicted secreted protein